jgi:hypothetical protein
LRRFPKKLYDAREEKVKDNRVFDLCDACIARDKKKAWVMFMDLKKTESGEAIQGALWWKFQLEWSKVVDKKRSAFTEEECARIGGQLIRSSIFAHMGKRDIFVELEKVILSV